MQRRDFLKSLGLTVVYSVVVRAGPRGTRRCPPPENRRRYFKRIVPPLKGRQTLAAESPMTLVDLACDVLVAAVASPASGRPWRRLLAATCVSEGGTGNGEA